MHATNRVDLLICSFFSSFLLPNNPLHACSLASLCNGSFAATCVCVSGQNNWKKRPFLVYLSMDKGELTQTDRQTDKHKGVCGQETNSKWAVLCTLVCCGWLGRSAQAQRQSKDPRTQWSVQLLFRVRSMINGLLIQREARFVFRTLTGCCNCRCCCGNCKSMPIPLVI